MVVLCLVLALAVMLPLLLVIRATTSFLMTLVTLAGVTPVTLTTADEFAEAPAVPLLGVVISFKTLAEEMFAVRLDATRRVRIRSTGILNMEKDTI